MSKHDWLARSPWPPVIDDGAEDSSLLAVAILAASLACAAVIVGTAAFFIFTGFSS